MQSCDIFRQSHFFLKAQWHLGNPTERPRCEREHLKRNSFHGSQSGGPYLGMAGWASLSWLEVPFWKKGREKTTVRYQHFTVVPCCGYVSSFGMSSS